LGTKLSEALASGIRTLTFPGTIQVGRASGFGAAAGFFKIPEARASCRLVPKPELGNQDKNLMIEYKYPLFPGKAAPLPANQTR
jgi:hypothetical protein